MSLVVCLCAAVEVIISCGRRDSLVPVVVSRAGTPSWSLYTHPPPFSPPLSPPLLLFRPKLHSASHLFAFLQWPRSVFLHLLTLERRGAARERLGGATLGDDGGEREGWRGGRLKGALCCLRCHRPGAAQPPLTCVSFLLAFLSSVRQVGERKSEWARERRLITIAVLGPW